MTISGAHCIDDVRTYWNAREGLNWIFFFLQKRGRHLVDVRWRGVPVLQRDPEDKCRSSILRPHSEQYLGQGQRLQKGSLTDDLFLLQVFVEGIREPNQDARACHHSHVSTKRPDQDLISDCHLSSSIQRLQSGSKCRRRQRPQRPEHVSLPPNVWSGRHQKQGRSKST